MKKILVFIIVLLLFLIALLTFLLAKPNNYLNYYTHTKAICNETNYCQDYSISCSKGQIKLKSPITNAVIQYSQNWTDPRNKAEKELC